MAHKLLALSLTLAGLADAKPDGTCGYQCKEASECGGCGLAGTCSCPGGKSLTFIEIGCTCVSAPPSPPAEPVADIADSVWPSQWQADVGIWNYKDFSDKAETASGRFYYDATLGKTRLDWLIGKKGKQVWIGSGPGQASSDYYAMVGPICLKFKITDPGVKGKPMVGIEYPDWMKRCNDAGLATYVGREQIHMGTEDVWVDHYSCRLDYINDMTNQSITFQNWHSLGLNSAARGLPLRVTGGNSKPDPNKSPRLNTVWYSNFVTGPNATTPKDFEPPKNPFGLPCAPLMGTETERFFGHPVTTDHIRSPAFHRRAAFLPHMKATKRDLQRAKQPKPSAAFAAGSFREAMKKLNDALRRDEQLKTQPCRDFKMDELHDMQRLLFDARTPELDAVYSHAGDTRLMAHANVTSLESEQRKLSALHVRSPELAAKARDGTCHEMVLWYVHHLSESAREEVKDRLVLPLLPQELHEAPPTSASSLHKESHERYSEQVSCAICHVTPGGTAIVV